MALVKDFNLIEAGISWKCDYIFNEQPSLILHVAVRLSLRKYVYCIKIHESH